MNTSTVTSNPEDSLAESLQNSSIAPSKVVEEKVTKELGRNVASYSAEESEGRSQIELAMITENLRFMRLNIIQECEAHFEHGLTTGRDTVDVLNHVFSHIQQGIPPELISAMGESELVDVYFKKVKELILTYVEYLHLVRGIDWYLLKAFLANSILFLEELYSERKAATQDFLNNLSVLKFTNTFLPELVSNLKNKENLTNFNSELQLIIFKLMSLNQSLEACLENSEFSLMFDQFRSKYFDCDEATLIRILRKLNASLDIVGSLKRPNGESLLFSVISVLNHPEYIGRNMDYFVNRMSRDIRLEVLESSANQLLNNPQKAMDSMNIPISESHRDSRLSIYQTRKEVDASNKISRIEKSAMQGYPIKRFNIKMRTLINSITQSSSDEGILWPPQSLKRIFEDDKSMKFENVQEIVHFFFQIFETAILDLDEYFLESSGMTIDEDSIIQLLEFWVAQLENHYEFLVHNPISTPIIDVEKINFYVMNEIRAITHRGSNSGEVSFRDYSQNLSKRLDNKIIILEAHKETAAEEEVIRQYVLEIFISAFRPDYIYYADNIDQLASDVVRKGITLPKNTDFVNHVLRSISSSAWVRFGVTAKFGTIAKHVIDCAERFPSLIRTISSSLEVRNGEDLTLVLAAHLRVPATRPLVDLNSKAEA